MGAQASRAKLAPRSPAAPARMPARPEQISISGPAVSGILLAKAGRSMESRRYAK